MRARGAVGASVMLAWCVGCGGSLGVGGAVPDAGPRHDAGPGHPYDAGPFDAGAAHPAPSVIVDHDDTVDDAFATMAASAIDGAAHDASLDPTIVYPYDGTVMPPNLYLVDWQWQPVRGADVYVSTLTSEVATVYFVSTHDSFVLPAATWRSLTAARLDGTITLTVRATHRADLSHVGSATIQVHIGPDDLMGGLYYFSTTEGASSQGIFRYDFGVPVATASRFLTEGLAGGCVGCHALSRDGSHMGVTFDGGYGFFTALDVTNPTRFLFGGSTGPERGGFLQYFDSDRTLLAVYDDMIDAPTDPLNGQIVMYDATTGALDPAHHVPLDPGTLGSHVAVAPDGVTIAYVQYDDTTNRPIHMTHGSLRVVVWDPTARTWGAPRVLVPFDGHVNDYYPSFSPDGQWLLFTRAPGDAYDNADAATWVVRVDGTTTPIELANANRTMHVTNSWPRWAPFVQHDEFGASRMWFAFSSKRDYGLRLVGVAKSQLWMAAFDPAAALGGSDGSAPAFWLPFQDITTTNHTPSWTERVAPRECTMDADCLDATLRCDPGSYTCVPTETVF